MTETPIAAIDDQIHPGGRIVVGVDGSASSLSALRRGARIAERLDCRLVGVTVWEFPASWPGYQMSGWSPEADARSIADEASADVFGPAAPAWYSSVIRSGSTARQLIAESEGAEMLIVGSRGLGGFTGLLLGSVSRACVEHADCPVLVIH
ncbi:universal stress protein [Leifsonia sp. LS1]|uniref:universal stress protein n=1 Tax=unclassified Leifsonia TaxID=2663824 RepID=UPI001CBF2AB9|nr:MULTISPECIES: universal stress protein [unclassified Leifsonia]UAJ77816.1 universal stress protein [Leifsonia sp. ZF2019]GIT81778.1 universal stress protein [Leifsonia sp. LS1]